MDEDANDEPTEDGDQEEEEEVEVVAGEAENGVEDMEQMVRRKNEMNASKSAGNGEDPSAADNGDAGAALGDNPQEEANHEVDEDKLNNNDDDKISDGGANGADDADDEDEEVVAAKEDSFEVINW